MELILVPVLRYTHYVLMHKILHCGELNTAIETSHSFPNLRKGVRLFSRANNRKTLCLLIEGVCLNKDRAPDQPKPGKSM